ncbi:UDP-glucose 4-epimerase GalE [Mesorhizobium sp. B2-5-13]|uniref:UDP-glucose 4-epimerase GalE n=1 Tax=unclassified Mesorhizobium TaxID=325217 RepID=UPI0011282F62|nr:MULTISPECIES: UDP-glucose 4-epimerase GalE [unclassified Mesorhizobium]TPJ38837.1 UDP-glucose 4-epimerase GalE [Mesorhizobium sp. B2-6-5]TPJ79484.1 UDP-glucose 4-epimerase GalE [Mesorhizobium sp. B2-5-13]TPK46303.1 UDP-glucose 4-epimerase GalE [Mesorhizobium sp. B2-5-5]TPL97186.1 UDP-glucose 4-epimerase GalE [Mesorhizobium sp. B2-3-11]
MKTVLVTGGAGYIGSHCCKAFAEAGWSVIAYDNLSRGWRDAVKWGPLVEGDICDAAAVSAALRQYKPDVVAHFAAYAYVGESVERPELYYRNNSFGSLVLFEEMLKAGADKLIFSSTCASYGVPVRSPIDEMHPQSPINPYGWSKFIIERMVDSLSFAHGLNAVMLRYFNAAGCDPDGEIGERHEPETHVIPLAIEAAVRPGRIFTVNGTDFDTRDGTAVRDYVHVTDLARAHVLAGEKLLRDKGVDVYNLGTGTGTTVKELVDAVNRASGSRVPVVYGPRRAGDPPALVAAAGKAHRELGWVPEQSGIDRIVETALAWYRSR